jgi:hypothetical protein
MSGGIAIMIGLSLVGTVGGHTVVPPGTTFYILAEDSSILQCENGDLLRTEQN